MKNQNIVHQQDFIIDADKILAEQDSLANAKNHTISTTSNKLNLTT